MFCFSPVAGIQWVETLILPKLIPPFPQVSVPLPGFSGLRHWDPAVAKGLDDCFSPVAGIQWVETSLQTAVEQSDRFQSRCRDSVG